MPTAKKDDINIVEIESEGYNKEKVKVPVLAMRGATDLQTYVDILVPANAKLTLIKVKGKGDDSPASPIKTRSSPMEKTDSKKRKASEDEKVVEKKAKASPAK